MLEFNLCLRQNLIGILFDKQKAFFKEKPIYAVYTVLTSIFFRCKMVLNSDTFQSLLHTTR